MGFVAFLKLAAKSFDLLAWPLITIVYPLYASIQAIESNSNADNRKWLTYWVLYSLIFLFELASAKLIQWLPFWPYLKFIVTFYLVAPQFDGAAYVYEQFVRPYIFVNPQALGNQFINQQEEFLMGRSDDFLVVAERYIKEDGSNALEKLIINKAKSMEHNLIGSQHKAVKATENVEVAAERVKLKEPNLADTENKTGTTKEKKATEAPAGECKGSEIPGSPIPKKAQKEWTCALCQVSTHSEVVLIDHLRGKKHKVKEEELLANRMASKKKADSVLAPKEADQPTVAPKKGLPTNEATPMNGKKQDKKDVGSNVSLEKLRQKNQGSELWKKNSTLWCAKCKIWCNSKSVMDSHLTGKKHKALQATSIGADDY